MDMGWLTMFEQITLGTIIRFNLFLQFTCLYIQSLDQWFPNFLGARNQFCGQRSTNYYFLQGFADHQWSAELTLGITDLDYCTYGLFVLEWGSPRHGLRYKRGMQGFCDDNTTRIVINCIKMGEGVSKTLKNSVTSFMNDPCPVWISSLTCIMKRVSQYPN